MAKTAVHSPPVPCLDRPAGAGAGASAGRSTLTAGARRLGALPEDSKSLLLAAASKGDIKAVQRALALSSPVDARNEKGLTALHLAARRGYSEIVQQLLSAGADPKLRDWERMATPLLLAAGAGHLKVVTLLLASRQGLEVPDVGGRSALQEAAANGHEAVVEAILRRGAKINHTDKICGSTALIDAAAAGHLRVVQQLLRRKAKLSTATNKGMTALKAAGTGGHSTVVTALLRAGAERTPSCAYFTIGRSLPLDGRRNAPPPAASDRDSRTLRRSSLDIHPSTAPKKMQRPAADSGDMTPAFTDPESASAASKIAPHCPASATVTSVVNRKGTITSRTASLTSTTEDNFANLPSAKKSSSNISRYGDGKPLAKSSIGISVAKVSDPSAADSSAAPTGSPLSSSTTNAASTSSMSKATFIRRLSSYARTNPAIISVLAARVGASGSVSADAIAAIKSNLAKIAANKLANATTVVSAKSSTGCPAKPTADNPAKSTTGSPANSTTDCPVNTTISSPAKTNKDSSANTASKDPPGFATDVAEDVTIAPYTNYTPPADEDSPIASEVDVTSCPSDVDLLSPSSTSLYSTNSISTTEEKLRAKAAPVASSSGQLRPTVDWELQTPAVLAAAADQLKAQNEHISAEPGLVMEREGLLAVEAAATLGEVEAMQTLLEAGAPTEGTADVLHPAPIFVAAERGHAKCVKLLVDHGADVHWKDARRWTPLVVAALRGHTDCCKVLLDAGANPNVLTKGGWTAVMGAAWRGHRACVEELVDRGADVNKRARSGATPLYCAAEAGHLPCVQLLIDSFVDLNTPFANGATPVYVAAARGHAAVISALAQAGADINRKRDDGFFPLHAAAEMGKVDCITTLVSFGASVHAANDYGDEPIHLAGWRGQIAALEALVKLGARPGQQRASDLATPLHLAAGAGALRSLRFLVEAGADINAQDSNGNTPLHDGARAGRRVVVQNLLDLGANPLVLNRQGQLPYTLAKRSWVRTLLPSELPKPFKKQRKVTSRPVTGLSGQTKRAASRRPATRPDAGLSTRAQRGAKKGPTSARAVTRGRRTGIKSGRCEAKSVLQDMKRTRPGMKKGRPPAAASKVKE